MNYDFNELGLYCKSLFNGQLTVEEQKQSNLYMEYQRLNHTSVKSDLIKKNIKTWLDDYYYWEYPYGRLSVTLTYKPEDDLSNEEQRVRSKSFKFNTWKTTFVDDETLLVLLSAKHFNDMKSILGDPYYTSLSYENDEPIAMGYEWAIKSRITDEALAMKGGDVPFIQIPVRTEGATFNRKVRRRYDILISVDKDYKITDIMIFDEY